jgi:hypothetical protein
MAGIAALNDEWDDVLVELLGIEAACPSTEDVSMFLQAMMCSIHNQKKGLFVKAWQDWPRTNFEHMTRADQGAVRDILMSVADKHPRWLSSPVFTDDADFWLNVCDDILGWFKVQKIPARRMRAIFLRIASHAKQPRNVLLCACSDDALLPKVDLNVMNVEPEWLQTACSLAAMAGAHGNVQLLEGKM